MCSQYTLKTKISEISDLFGVTSSVEQIESRFLPYQTAPVLVWDRDRVRLTGMNFSLVPSWSKDPKVKFATHNARIETVHDKPTWKIPFERQHCLIPMSGFFESAYEGPLAGHIIRFEKPDHSLLFAAGIYDRWQGVENVDASVSSSPHPRADQHTRKHTESKIIHSFSILTTTPTEFIEHYGHDRSPIFVTPEFGREWLKLSGPALELQKTLLDHIVRPELTVQPDRALKPGWEKRKV